jgi:hypothetical protein
VHLRRDEDVDGVEVGPYADFDAFRSFVTAQLEGGNEGSRFPTLIMHSDCDGEWSVEEVFRLGKELEVIGEEMKRFAAIPFPSEWQATIARFKGIRPCDASESFIDVDGEPLVQRLKALADESLSRNLPISFQ